MKKIIYSSLLIVFLNVITGCGYEPIFVTKGPNIKIINQYFDGDVGLGKKIFSKLNELLVGAENAKEVDIHINANKSKIATNKSTAGKVLEYRITLKVEFKITETNSDKILLKKGNALISQKYKVQSQISETEKLEKNTLENLINKMNRKLAIKVLQLSSDI